MDIRIEQLSARYTRQPVLGELDLDLPGAQVIAIVGANGCGKSTLLRCMARLQPCDAGRVLIGGQDIAGLEPVALARRVGFLPQFPQAPAGLTVAALVAFGRHPHRRLLSRWSDQDQDAVQDALRRTDLLALADRPIDTLSGGQRQRAWLAMVLAQQTPVLLLDEPTSMLDPGHQESLLALIRSLADDGRTVVMVLHDLSCAARHADRLVALHHGRVLASGPPRAVLSRELVLALYGIDVHILQAPDDGTPVIVPVRARPLQPSRPVLEICR